MNKTFIDLDKSLSQKEPLQAQTGCFYRAFDLIKFMKTMQAVGKEPVGFKFEEDSNNVEILFVETKK